MKKQIVNPDIRIVRFGAADIIVTSQEVPYNQDDNFSKEGNVGTPARRGIFD